MKKFSVIIPIYNVENYLRKCVDSVLNQNYKDMEIILVDDGSTDGSGKLADEIAKKNQDIVRVIHQENKGLGGARNTGIEAAEGEYLWFIDSDDYVDENSLIEISEFIDKHNPDTVVFDYVNVDEDGSVIENVSATLDKEITNIDESPELFFIACSACNKVFRRSLFVDNNITFPERDWFEDLATIVNLYPHMTKVGFIKKGFYKYLQRSGSIMHHPNVKRNVEIMKATDSFLNYYKANGYYEKYKDEISYLVILHVYVLATVRVIKQGGKNDLLKEFRNYVYKNAPNPASNKYLPYMKKKEQLIVKLLDKKMFSVLRMIFNIKDMLRK